MSSSSKTPKTPITSRNYRDLPSDGWPELIMFLPNRLIQIYCKTRKIDKISTLDATVIAIFGFLLFVGLIFLTNFIFII